MFNNLCKSCNGRCCRRFWLWTHDKKTGKNTTIRSNDKVYKAMSHIRRLTKAEIKAEFGYIPRRYKQIHTCTLFDRETGRCSDYDNRPSFCKEFMCQEMVEVLALTTGFPEAT